MKYSTIRKECYTFQMISISKSRAMFQKLIINTITETTLDVEGQLKIEQNRKLWNLALLSNEVVLIDGIAVHQDFCNESVICRSSHNLPHWFCMCKSRKRYPDPRICSDCLHLSPSASNILHIWANKSKVQIAFHCYQSFNLTWTKEFHKNTFIYKAL